MKHLPLSAAALLLATPSVQAASFSSPLVETKIFAQDASGQSEFGAAVAISGNIAIVGAPDTNDPVLGATSAGADFGAAYLFDTRTGAQIARLAANDGAANDNFGNAVGISGNVAIVGSERDDDAGESSGAAYLFDVTTGQQLHKLTADDATGGDRFGIGADFFGRSVAISGNVAIVGSLNQGDTNPSGAAYLFDVTTGNQIGKLTAADAAEFDDFGGSVAIDGNIAVVGAIGDDDGGSTSGSAYAFDVTTGNLIAKLTAPDADEFDRFGRSVDIYGSTAIIGAFNDDGNDDGTENNSGSAYLFNVLTGQVLAKLTADDADGGDFFGFSVGIHGDTAIVGSYRDQDSGPDSGSAYLFDVNTGNQITKLNADDAGPFHLYGVSVDISGTQALVGSQAADSRPSGSPFTTFDSGAAYIYSAPAAAVPLPAGAWLLLGAFGSLSILRRRAS